MKRLSVAFIFACALVCFGNSLPISQQAAFFGQKPAAAAGGGGGGCTPSYSNTGGQGNRSSIITVDDNSTSLVAGPVNLAQFVNGNYGDNNAFWNATTLDGTTYFVRFDFGSGHSAVITEATYYQSTTTAEGVWQWQGSNDNSTWTSIGSTFSLGGATTQVITTLSGNTTSYRYYRMMGISGTTSFTPWIRGMDFKLCYT